MDCCDRSVLIQTGQFQEELRHTAHLDGAFHRTHLRGLLLSGRLVVSRDGLSAACLVPDQDGLRVQIGAQVVPILFESHDSQALTSATTRLLELRAGQLLIFGTHSSGNTGLFRLAASGHVELLTLADEFLGVQSAPEGVIIFVRSQDDDPDIVRVCAPFLPGSLMVHRSAQVSALAEGTLLVLEPINLGRYGTHLHRYTVHHSRGFQNMLPVAVGHGEKVVGLVLWHGVFLLGVRGPKGSVLKGCGLPVLGELEHLWQSPTGKAFAWLTCITEPNGQMQRQFGINNRIIHTSDFATGPFDLVWSPDGKQAALRIREGMHPNDTEQLISSESRVHIGKEYHVEEFCVNDRGEIVAWIQTDGRFSEPIIRLRPHNRVEYAWNLAHESDGTISFNRVLADIVTKVSYRTHLVG